MTNQDSFENTWSTTSCIPIKVSRILFSRQPKHASSKTESYGKDWRDQTKHTKSSSSCLAAWSPQFYKRHTGPSCLEMMAFWRPKNSSCNAISGLAWKRPSRVIFGNATRARFDYVCIWINPTYFHPLPSAKNLGNESKRITSDRSRPPLGTRNTSCLWLMPSPST